MLNTVNFSPDFGMRNMYQVKPEAINDLQPFIKSKAGLAIIMVVVIALLGWLFNLFATRSVPALKQVTLDFAYYNPSSLVLKKYGWLEEAFRSLHFPRPMRASLPA